MTAILQVVNKELDITVYTVQGVVGYEELRAEIEKYYRGPLTKYVLWSFTEPGVDVNLKPGELRKLAELVNTEGKARRGGSDLLIIPDTVKYSLASTYIAYTEILNSDKDALKTVIFRKNDDAYKWIREDMKYAKSDWPAPDRASEDLNS